MVEDRFMVGRQPIFDERLQVYGYELLFRDGSASTRSGDVKTASVLVHTALDLGLANLVGNRPAFVNATRSFLLGEQDIPLPPDQLVIEVLEDVAHDEQLVAGCRRLVDAGYRLALDDYTWAPGDDELLELASFVKLDVLALPGAELPRQVERCARHDVTLVAEKVETRAQLATCRNLGFDLFQGYLLSRPEVVEGAALSPSRLTCLRLVERLSDSDVSPGDLEGIIATDPALSYRFLRAAGSGAAGGLRRAVSSIREGLVLLGMQRTWSWVTLMLLAGGDGGCDERLVIAMTRARMCELVASAVAPELRGQAFTVGLVSSLDLLLSAPLRAVLADLALARPLVEALLNRTGTLGAILGDVLGWEVDDVDRPLRTGVATTAMESYYLDAVAWATKITGDVEQAA